MKLVVDSNILFTFFWKNSTSKELFILQDIELFSPKFALVEIEKYSREIQKKAKISKEEFQDIKTGLMILVNFIPLEEYSGSLKKANSFTPDKEDVDFFALSLHMNCPLWSNDSQLKNQNRIKILTTTEIIEIIEY